VPDRPLVRVDVVGCLDGADGRDAARLRPAPSARIRRGDAARFEPAMARGVRAADVRPLLHARADPAGGARRAPLGGGSAFAGKQSLGGTRPTYDRIPLGGT